MAWGTIRLEKKRREPFFLPSSSFPLASFLLTKVVQRQEMALEGEQPTARSEQSGRHSLPVPTSLTFFRLREPLSVRTSV